MLFQGSHFPKSIVLCVMQPESVGSQRENAVGNSLLVFPSHFLSVTFSSSFSLSSPSFYFFPFQVLFCYFSNCVANWK